MTDLGSASLSRRNLLKIIAMAGGVATVPGLLTACTGGSPAPQGANPSVSAGTGAIDLLRVALPSSISSLDASKEAGIINYVVALLCQEALVSVGADGSLQPGLAQSWTRPDPVTYVYKIRTNAKFSDGTPLTVEDVIASLEYNAKPGSTSAFAYAYASVASIKKTAADEVTIKLKDPNSTFAWTVSPSTLLITSAKFLAANVGKIGTPQTKLLGTGPYTITEFVPDSHVSLQRNDTWWGPRPAAKAIRMDFVTDPATRLLAMRQKSFDVAMNLPLEQLDQWSALDGVDVEVTTDNSFVTLIFNTGKAPWSDRHVRAAVAHSIDRAGIVKSLLGGHGQVAVTFPTKQEWGGLLTAEQVDALYARIPQYDFDLAKAKAELALSTVPGGFRDTITYPNSGPQIGKALLTLVQNLKGLGITLTVKEVTLEQWIADLGKKEAGIATGWYFAATGDPSEYTQQLINGAYAGVGGTNIAAYNNDAVNALLNKELTTTDDTQRAQLLGDALVKAAADIPYQPLWWGEAATAFGPAVAVKDYGPYFYIGPFATHVYTRA